MKACPERGKMVFSVTFMQSPHYEDMALYHMSVLPDLYFSLLLAHQCLLIPCIIQKQTHLLPIKPVRRSVFPHHKLNHVARTIQKPLYRKNVMPLQLLCGYILHLSTPFTFHAAADVFSAIVPAAG